MRDDEVVAGAGTAGCAAVLAAARQGANAFLLERNGVLGGTTTALYRLHNRALDTVFCRDDYVRVLTDSLCYCVEHKGITVYGCGKCPITSMLRSRRLTGSYPMSLRMQKGIQPKCAAKLEADGRVTWLAAMRRAAGHAGVRVWDEAFHPERVHTQALCPNWTICTTIPCGYVIDPCKWKCSGAAAYHRDEVSVIPITAIEW